MLSSRFASSTDRPVTSGTRTRSLSSAGCSSCPHTASPARRTGSLAPAAGSWLNHTPALAVEHAARARHPAALLFGLGKRDVPAHPARKPRSAPPRPPPAQRPDRSATSAECRARTARRSALPKSIGDVRLLHDNEQRDLRIIRRREAQEGADVLVRRNHAVHIHLRGTGLAADAVAGYSARFCRRPRAPQPSSSARIVADVSALMGCARTRV